eukprot:jgi/Mesvir1/14418/Mv09801-RA.3
MFLRVSRIALPYLRCSSPFSSIMQSSRYQTYSVRDQVALVTGASSGIGEATAYALAELGTKLVLVARRQSKLEEVRERIVTDFKVPVHLVCMDVRERQKVAALPSELPAEFREVDILVNNAGLALGVAPAHETNLDDLCTMMDTNVIALAAFTNAFVPGMVARGRGHVVNMSSGYCASKFAVDAYTTAMRHDLVGTPIRVTAISPGAVKTEFRCTRGSSR